MILPALGASRLRLWVVALPALAAVGAAWAQGSAAPGSQPPAVSAAPPAAASVYGAPAAPSYGPAHASGQVSGPASARAPGPGWVPAPGYAPPIPGYVAPAYGPAPGLPLWLGVDEAPQRLDNYLAAGGPLERHTGRPGAWYAVVYVPFSAQWPVQLWAWQRTRSHHLRVTALDGWPAPAASAVVPLPVWPESTPSGRPLLLTTPFVLTAQSVAEGVFLLVEQFSATGERPAPVWLQARYAQAPSPYQRSRDGGWWQAEAAGTGARVPPSTTSSGAGAAPPSALMAPREALGVIELPFMRLATPMPRPAPVFDPWGER